MSNFSISRGLVDSFDVVRDAYLWTITDDDLTAGQVIHRLGLSPARTDRRVWAAIVDGKGDAATVPANGYRVRAEVIFLLSGSVMGSYPIFGHATGVGDMSAGEKNPELSNVVTTSAPGERAGGNHSGELCLNEYNRLGTYYVDAVIPSFNVKVKADEVIMRIRGGTSQGATAEFLTGLQVLSQFP